MTHTNEVSKKNLTDILRRLAEIAHQRNSQPLIERCTKLQQKLDDLTFNLLVLGEFKRGKSTLINALLGAELLPSATVPLTSIVTLVSYGKSPGLKVTFANGSEKNDSIENISSYVTERDNPQNALGVKTVNAYYPSAILGAGIRIIDTPGTGSVFEHNTQATIEFLPEADAAIFVFAADQPATRAELDLLQTTRQYSVKEFMVLNKIDHLDEKGKIESLEFLEMVVGSQLDQKVSVFPLSAKTALNQKLEALSTPSTEPFRVFESAILEFFREGKNKALLESIAHKISGSIIELQDLIALETAARAMAPDRLNSALTQFHEKSAALLDEQTDAKYIVGGEIRQIVNTVESDLKIVVEEHSDTLEKTIDREFEEHSSLHKDVLIDTLRSSLTKHISDILGDWMKTEDVKINKRFESLNARFVDKANETIAVIEKTTSEFFDVKVTTQFDIEKITTRSRHFYAVAHPFALALEMAPLLLPAFLAKRIIKRKFLLAAHHELSKNAGRLRADYQERIESSAHDFLQHFHERVTGALSEIEAVVQRASKLKDVSLEDKQKFEVEANKQKCDILDMKTELANYRL